ncbi:IclR family transcriptional regulator [Luteococcus sp. OSA5]|uniref:IclR family transcriptional regulator n=1 Tax=Luteococcus sp. OSA5 TaxID=3401630 RepID=UPI003B436790
MTSSERDTRTAVDKALALLTAFGTDAAVGVGVSELARRAELSKSTAFRLLGTLERNGAVERAGTNYRLGPMLHELAAPVTMPETDLVRDTFTPFLAHLYERTRQTVHLAVLDGPNVVYLNKLHGLQHVPAPSRIGGRIPAYCTAVGKAMMAFNPALTEQVLASELAPWTPRTVTTPEALQRELARVRAEGVAFDREEIRMGLVCVAAPIMSPTGAPVAAMSVSGPTTNYDPRSMAPALRAVCGEASKAYAARLRALRRHS